MKLKSILYYFHRFIARNWDFWFNW